MNRKLPGRLLAPPHLDPGLETNSSVLSHRHEQQVS